MQPSTFANNLRVQRVKANLNQAQLAQAIGYAQNQISKWEVGAASPRVSQLLLIADVLHCTPADLLAGCSTATDPRAAPPPGPAQGRRPGGRPAAATKPALLTRDPRPGRQRREPPTPGV